MTLNGCVANLQRYSRVLHIYGLGNGLTSLGLPGSLPPVEYAFMDWLISEMIYSDLLSHIVGL